MKKKVLVLLIFICLLIFTSCSTSKNIVGNWLDDNGSSYTFYKDGTLTIGSGLLSTSGTYTFIDNNTVKIQLDGLLGIGGATVFEVEIHKGELLLSNGGQVITLRKSD